MKNKVQNLGTACKVATAQGGIGLLFGVATVVITKALGYAMDNAHEKRKAEQSEDIEAVEGEVEDILDDEDEDLD